MAYEVNAFCQRTKFGLNIQPEHGQQAMAASLLIKMLCDFQAAIIVLERGLVLQGQALLRCALEALFLVKRVADDPAFMAIWAKADETDRLRMFERVQSGPGGLPSSITSAALQEKIDQTRVRIKAEEIKRLRVADVMADPELKWLPSLYSLWSLPVHSAPRAVQEYVQTEPLGAGIGSFKLGPSEDDLEFTLTMGAIVMLSVWEPLTKVFGVDVQAEVDKLDERLRALVSASGPRAEREPR